MPNMQIFQRKHAEQTTADENEEFNTDVARRVSAANSLTEAGSMVEVPNGTGAGSQTSPIERFRAQYGNDAAYLRERDMYDPHPSEDHAWIAAGIVNKFGFYQPCISYAQDRAAAVAKYEENRHREDEEERHLQAIATINAKRRDAAIQAALSDPNSGLHQLQEYAGGADPIRNVVKKSLLETGEEAGKVVTYKMLAIARGYKAAQDILASGARCSLSAQRGRRLLKKAERREQKQMLADYLEEMGDSFDLEDLDASGVLIPGEVTDDDGWTDINADAESTPNDDPVESADAIETASLLSFTDMEGTFAVENGRPLVKSSSMKKLFQMVVRH